MKVLLSAYACEPNKGSEPGVGWNWTKYLSTYSKIIVVTRKNNRHVIEKHLKQLNKPNNVRFIYFDLPRPFIALKKSFGIHFYYHFWQKGLYRFLKNNKVLLKDVDVIHHLTFNEFREPGYLWKLDKKFILGPIGGAQNSKFLFTGVWGYSFIKEIFRDCVNIYYLKFSYRVKQAIKKSSVVFVADSTTFKKLPIKYRHKYIQFLETGISGFTKGKRKKRKSDTLQILWSGSLIPRKGLPILLKVAKKIKSNALFRVVGSGKYETEYKAFVTKNNLKNVIFEGGVTFQQMQNYYTNADLFIFTSLRDTSGNVVLEAMSNGVPTIVLNHHGAADIIGEKGLRIETNSIEQIISDIAKLISKNVDNPYCYSDIVKYQFKRLEKYLWKNKTKEIHKYYSLVLKER